MLEVSIDLWKPYKSLVLELMPNFEITADRFHVMKHGSVMDFGILKISEFVPYYLGISILFLHKGSGRTI
jgi:hypothetical protein